jgi:MerR family transcriptional regulator, heat shock protein HspR
MPALPKEIDNPETPLFPIGVVAELLNVTDQTLRVYEKNGLITPLRRNKDRYYSANDIVWLKCLRRFLKEEGLNLKGIEKLMKFVPCYEISPCEDCCECTAYLKRSIPCWESAAKHSPSSQQFCPHCDVFKAGLAPHSV